MSPTRRLELWDEEPCNSLCFVKGPIIVGAGPSGLALAACLRQKGIPSLLIERHDCVASLWRYNTYDRIHLHLPKHFCHLPLYPIPDAYPTYLSTAQFLSYLDRYSELFRIKPRFNETVSKAWFDPPSGLWRVRTCPSARAALVSQPAGFVPPDGGCGGDDGVREYAGHWLVVATGENADAFVPAIPGQLSFKGSVVHSSRYKNGRGLEGRNVLVVGCGNSGMEIALDLVESNANPSLVVRDKIHVLPHQILGKSTYTIIARMLNLFPVWLTDQLLLLYAWCKWMNTAACGLPRPSEGPIAYKNTKRRTPVLDIGTLPLIKSGQIKVFPGVKRFTPNGTIFENGHFEEFDDIILATGYRSNVNNWLSGEDETFDLDGLPRASSCKGKRGLYILGLSGMGLPGITRDASSIAEDIKTQYFSFYSDPK